MAAKIFALIELVEQPASDRLSVRGVFTDKSTFKIPFARELVGVSTLSQVQSQLSAAYVAATQQTTVRLDVFPGAELDVTPAGPIDPPAHVPPTQDELDAQAYARAVLLLAEARALVANGAAQTLVDNAVTLVQTRRPPMDKQFQARFDAEVAS